MVKGFTECPLNLTAHTDGVDIEVPAATILSMFGFNAQAFWFPDVTLLISCFVVSVVASYLCLIFFVRERR